MNFTDKDFEKAQHLLNSLFDMSEEEILNLIVTAGVLERVRALILKKVGDLKNVIEGTEEHLEKFDFEGCRPPEESLYKSNEWKALRTSYRKAHPLCELCLGEGTEAPSHKIHHITPISQGGLSLSEENLIALKGTRVRSTFDLY